MTSRYSSAVLISAGITFVLFLFMQMLVATDTPEIEIIHPVRYEGVIQEIPEIEVTKIIPKPVDIVPVEDEPVIEVPPTINPNTPGFATENLPTKVPPGWGVRPGLLTDGTYLPIVKVAPRYPIRALKQGIEGYTIVEFTVTESGAVENAVTIYAEPKGYFERASETAALKFKYKPRIVDGEAVRVIGVQNQFTFNLDEQ